METSAVGKRCQNNGGVKRSLEMDKKKNGEKRQTRVKVVIRVRPPLTPDSKVCVGTVDNKVEIFNHRNVRENLQYEFSSVYDRTRGQREIFEACVCPLLGHAMNGENVSIFAYGPTGAGKTYTMLGTEDDPGMIPRVIRSLFNDMPPTSTSSAASTQPLSQSYKVSFSYLEIYNEKVQDLLNPSETDLPIREDGNHNIFVAGLTEKVICNFSDFKNLFGPASNNRTVAATKLNDRSSRSHCIVQLKVDSRRNDKVYHGKIYLIDLAGSEDNRRTGNKGLRLKESGAINKSLFVLGEVVDAINNNLPRIPYRNSKLTRLLQDSIGGSCHSVMITNVAPEESFYYDTYCTLNFATKSRKIINNNVASVSFDRPAEPSKGLKRNNSDSQMNSSAGSKRAKLSPGHTTSDPSISTASVSVPIAPLVPIVERQDLLEQTMKGCMQQIEQLMEKINTQPVAKVKVHKVSSKPDPAMANIQAELRKVQARLKDIQKQQQQEQQKKPEKNKAREKTSDQKADGQHSQQHKTSVSIPPIDTVLRDKTNVKKDQGEGNTRRGGGKGFMLEEPSCSPLFVTLPKSQPFHKGFKSTACSSALACTTPGKFKSDAANFSSQHKKQNAAFLHILNTAEVRRLQELHTVGVKRARLIYQWRQTHGHFTSFEELGEIPGFTQKYVNSLLERNFVLTDV